MYAEIGHKISCSALCISLAACIALCVTVTPNEKAYADSGYTEVQLLEYIETRLHEISITLESIGYTASPNPASHTTIYDLINLNAINTDAVYNVLSRIESSLVDSSSNSSFASLIRNHLNTWNPYFVYFNSWQDSVNINGTTYYTPIYYLKQTYGKLDMVFQAIVLSNESLWQADSYQDDNGVSHYTPFYYLKKISASIGEVTNGWFKAEDNTFENSSFRNSWNGFSYYVKLYLERLGLNGSSWYKAELDNFTNTNFRDSWNSITSNVHFYLSTIRNDIRTIVENTAFLANSWYKAGSENFTNNAFRDSWNGFAYYVSSYIKSIKDYSLSMDNRLNTLHSDFGTLGNNLSGISDSINAILALMAMDDVVSDVVGDFDAVDFSDNVDDVKDDMQNIAVYSSVVALGTYISQLNVQPVSNPSITMPFTFAGSNESVVISVSWLDDVKPLINFALLFMLFLGLTAWSVNIVSRGQS